MSTRIWEPKAVAVAQVSTIQITADDAATTYKVTIGGITISVAGSGSGVNQTASDLKDALDASTHPYFAAVTWTVATDTITGTADTAGVPFTATSSVSGGAGTIGAVTESTAATGPNHWSEASNWSGETLPVATDTVVFANSNVNCCWGIDQNAITLAELRIEKSYTGKIGLNSVAFATSADGATVNTAAPEYREVYHKISATVCDIGENMSQSSPAGSQRIMLDLGSNASTVTVFGTASSSSETGRPAVRLMCNHASTVLYVRSAPGGVGVAIDAAGETSTLSKISISDTSTSSKVYTSSGVTLTTWEQTGGNNVMNLAGTLTTLTINGGNLRSEGDYTITTVTLNGGTYYSNHVKSAGNAITTGNINGGTLDGLQSSVTRTWATISPATGATLKLDASVVTITTLNDPTGRYKATYASP